MAWQSLSLSLNIKKANGVFISSPCIQFVAPTSNNLSIRPQNMFGKVSGKFY